MKSLLALIPVPLILAYASFEKAWGIFLLILLWSFLRLEILSQRM
jgi:hypothetical protein